MCYKNVENLTTDRIRPHVLFHFINDKTLNSWIKNLITKCLRQTGQNGAIKSRYGVEEKNKKDSNKQQLLTKVDFKIQSSWNRTVVMTNVWE